MVTEKITFKELQDLRFALWNGKLSREQCYRLVDVINFLMEKVSYSELI